MSWPTDIHGRPLEHITKLTDNGDALPECQICGGILSGYGGHDEHCGSTTRSYLGWALRQLMDQREAEGKPRVPRNSLDEYRELAPEQRRKAFATRPRRRRIEGLSAGAIMELLEADRQTIRSGPLADVCTIPACGCDGRAHS